MSIALLRRAALTWCVLLLVVGGCGAQDLRVSHVVDGDTFELSDGRRVRLIGVETPEKYMSDKLRRDSRPAGRDIETIQALGRKASEYARRLVEGKRVALEYDPASAARDHKGSYGRTLAYVWVLDNAGHRQLNVNERLIRQGYANAYVQYSFQYRERYRRLQREARGNARGLWGRVNRPATKSSPQTRRDSLV